MAFVGVIAVVLPLLVYVQRAWTRYLWARRLSVARSRAESAGTDPEPHVELGVLCSLAGTEKEDIAITPLAIPMLAGPGAISTAVLLHSQARGWDQNVALYACIIAVCVASYCILRVSARGAKWLTPIAMKIVIRVMGLLLAALAFQFLINAVNELRKAG